MISILCATNDNYASQCGIMLTSVCENNRNVDIHICINSQLSKQNLKKFSRLKKKYNVNIQYIDCSVYNSVAPLLPDHLSIETCYRIFAAQFLPATLDKILYLDCDIVVNASLDELWQTDISGKSVAAGTDYYLQYLVHYNEKIDLSPDNLYFNSGMLLINLRFWRQHDLSSLFLNCGKERTLQFFDQDILNIVLQSSKVIVDLKWNALAGIYYNSSLESLPQEIQTTILNTIPIIIHYAGLNPRHIDYWGHPFTKEFDFYKRLSPWKYTPYIVKRHYVRKWVKYVMKRSGLLKFDYDTIQPVR